MKNKQTYNLLITGRPVTGDLWIDKKIKIILDGANHTIDQIRLTLYDKGVMEIIHNLYVINGLT